MLKKIKSKCFLLFLWMSLSLNLTLCMEFNGCDDHVVNALKNTEQIAQSIPDLVQKALNFADAQEKKQLDGIANNLKDKNTILLKLGKYFACYKGDLLSGSFFALDLFLELLVYNKVFQQKVDYVLKVVKEDSKQLEDLLRKAESAQKVHDAKNRIVRFLANRFKTLPEVLALKTYINDKHKMIGYNPFKRSLLPYLAFNLIKTKAIFFVEKLISPALVYGHLKTDTIAQISESAYERDNQGNLHKLDKAPFSIMTILMCLLNPRYMLERIDWLSGSSLQVINKFLNLNIPNFVFSNLVASICSLGLAVKFTDTLLNSSWSAYMLKNKEIFLKLLADYNSIDKANLIELEKVEKELRKFITVGHTQGIVSHLWAKKRAFAQVDVKLLLLSPAIVTALWKLYSYYRT